MAVIQALCDASIVLQILFTHLCHHSPVVFMLTVQGSAAGHTWGDKGRTANRADAVKLARDGSWEFISARRTLAGISI
jgi:hypothetical protein